MLIHKHDLSVQRSQGASTPSANPADWIMTNSGYWSSPAPTPASPTFSSRPFLMSILWAAWEAWDDLPKPPSVEAIKFCEFVSPVFGSSGKCGLSAWPCGSAMAGIRTWGVLLVFASPFVKTNNIYYHLGIRSHCKNYSYTKVIWERTFLNERKEMPSFICVGIFFSFCGAFSACEKCSEILFS